MILIGLALTGSDSPQTVAYAAGFFFWFGTVLLVPSLIGGIGLLRNKRWGRIVLIIVSAEWLFAFPVGTPLGVYGLWTLLNRNVQAEFAKAPSRPFRVDSRQRGLLLAMLSVAAAFVLVLGAGFLLSRHTVRTIPMNGTFGVIAGIAIIAVAFTVARFLGIPAGTPHPSPKLPATRPPRPPAAPPASQDQKAYASEPHMTVTCPHLQPFERAMRSAGIAVARLSDTAVNARCRIHRRGLRGQFALPEPVQYREYFEAERYFEDFPIARLQCRQCTSSIATLHPYECNLSTPWFPAAPAPPTLRAERPCASKIDVTAIACSPTGRLAAIAAGIHNTPQEIAIWDAASCECLQPLPPHGVIRQIAWSPDEKLLVTGRGILWTQGQGSQGASIFVWDAASGKELLRFGDHLFGVRGIALSPDGRTLLASGMLGKTPAEGSTLDLWDVRSGMLLSRLARVEAEGNETLPLFSGVAFTPDGTLALAASFRYKLPGDFPRSKQPAPPAWWNRGVRAWKLSGQQEIDLIPQATSVRTISISRDGTRLLTAGDRFGVWNLTTGSLLWDKINGAGIGIAASPDCSVVARGIGYREDNHGPYIDTAVELYDGAGGDLISLAPHHTPPTAIAFVASANSFIAGGLEGELRFWSWKPDFL